MMKGRCAFRMTICIASFLCKRTKKQGRAEVMGLDSQKDVEKIENNVYNIKACILLGNKCRK